MSYDVSVWVRADLETARESLQALGLAGQDQLLLERSAWAISAFVHPIEPEDIPPEVTAVFRGPVTLIELHLSPIGASFAAYRHLRKIARGVAKTAEGAVEDLQTGEVWVPPSLRLAKAVRQAVAADQQEGERATVLSFGWWFAHDLFTDRDGLRALLSEIEAVLPEALPRRYGPYEPLKYRRDRDGIDHYLDLLVEDDDGVEVASTAPAQDLRISTVKLPGEKKLHREIMFRSRYIRFDVDGAVLSAPGYQAHLIHAFRTLSDFVRPFYGEVRPIRNMIRAGGEC
ncbi:hypothetical protein AADZ90_000685 [Aestuariibius sp. 2305UL40-4]|uniref:hypothetical protein n=1 Tax=Aestuariibius violaceus TaxID=3234132 RepID=UPI00345EB1A2